jgi:hypothetical protein
MSKLWRACQLEKAIFQTMDFRDLAVRWLQCRIAFLQNTAFLLGRRVHGLASVGVSGDAVHEAEQLSWLRPHHTGVDMRRPVHLFI